MRIALTRPAFVLAVSAAWTAVVWGSRVRLLGGEGTTIDWIRIGGSLAFAVVLFRIARRLRRHSPINLSHVLAISGYAVWMIALWVPSVLSVSAGGYSFGFVTVHTVLALVSLWSAVLVGEIARRLDMINRVQRPTTPPRTAPTGRRWSIRRASWRGLDRVGRDTPR